MSADSAAPALAPVIPLSISGPGVAAKMLGVHLRRLRQDQGLKIKDAAPVIRASVSKISRLERGESPPGWRDVLDLAHYYGVRDETGLEEIRELLRRATEPSWWDSYGDVMPGWIKRLIGLEDAATALRTWQTMVIPGLLQTPEYARAIIRAGLPMASESEIERRVTLRLGRQHILYKETRPRVVAMLDEGILHRPVGGPQVMVEQLQRLRGLDETADVNIRVVTFEQSASGLIAPTPITHLTFDAGGPPEVVYLEHADGATYVTKAAVRQSHRLLLDNLFAMAQDRVGSLALLDQAIERFAAKSS